MAELAHFKNFAKLKDTSIEFNDITVLAGKPGTGKSYVMKSIYAFEESIVLSIKNNFQDNFKKHLGLPTSYDNNKLPKIPDNNTLRNVKVNTNELSSKIPSNIKNLLQSVFTSFYEISNDFMFNYKEISIFLKDDTLITKINSNKSIFVKSNIIFVETPLILEFHKHLDKRESKTPYHIESLINILDENYSFTDEEQDKLIKEFSKKVNNIIGGDIKSRNGSFVFSRNDDKDYNIFNASSGIKSIGLLQYLVTNKALKKGSVLFWEEPEVHLHPEWQKKMIELFIELMNAGVKIVFSTHSPYMCEHLNALVKNRNLTDRVSFNLLQESDGVVENTILKDSENWELIQNELLDPLEEIAWEYL